MGTSLKVFEYGEKQVRTVEKDGEVWFVAKDVCDILGLEDVNKATKRLDDDEKLTRKLFVSGQNRDVITVSESGLYTLILRSYKPEAKPFRRWVTHEVLPDIRKHDMYMSDKLRETAKVNSKAFNAVVNKYLTEKEKTCALEDYIEKNRAYTQIGKIITSVEKCFPIADAATMCAQHGYDIGRNRVYKLLRSWDFICSQKKRRNKPTQKGVEQGVVNLELTAEGNYVITAQTTITPKGMRMILDFLQGEQRPLEALWEAKEKEQRQ